MDFQSVVFSSLLSPEMQNDVMSIKWSFNEIYLEMMGSPSRCSLKIRDDQDIGSCKTIMFWFVDLEEDDVPMTMTIDNKTFNISLQPSGWTDFTWTILSSQKNWAVNLIKDHLIRIFKVFPKIDITSHASFFQSSPFLTSPNKFTILSNRPYRTGLPTEPYQIIQNSKVDAQELEEFLMVRSDIDNLEVEANLTGSHLKKCLTLKILRISRPSREISNQLFEFSGKYGFFHRTYWSTSNVIKFLKLWMSGNNDNNQLEIFYLQNLWRQVFDINKIKNVVKCLPFDPARRSAHFVPSEPYDDIGIAYSTCDCSEAFDIIRESDNMLASICLTDYGVFSFFVWKDRFPKPQEDGNGDYL